MNQTEAQTEAAALRQYAQYVEREVLAARDERTRFIRLVILAVTEAALAEVAPESEAK